MIIFCILNESYCWFGKSKVECNFKCIQKFQEHSCVTKNDAVRINKNMS